MIGVATRFAIAAAALAGALLLWSWLGAASSYERAIDAVNESGGRLSPGQAKQVRDDLRSAARHTPSTEPELAIAQLDLFLDEPRRAAVVLREVLRREPENAAAWGLLAIALSGVDEPTARDAARREAQLRGGIARRHE